MTEAHSSHPVDGLEAMGYWIPMLRGTLLVTLLLSAACGDDDRVPTDGGPARDLGITDMSMDAGSVADAGSADGSAESDGGAAADSGTDAGEGTTDGGPVESDAGPLACVDGPLTLDSKRTSTTIGGADVRNPDGSDCIGAIGSGPERVFLFTAPDTDDYRITVDPQNDTFDPMIYVQESCNDSTPCIAGTRLQGPGGTDVTTVSITGGFSVVITVDTDLGAGGDSGGGPFSIVVERMP